MRRAICATWAIAEPSVNVRRSLVFDGFLLRDIARFIEATIARRKVIVIDFNHDDVRGALAARARARACIFAMPHAELSDVYECIRYSISC